MGEPREATTAFGEGGVAELWPSTDLRIAAGDLELRFIDDALLFELAELASRGVHASAAMPFSVPWSRGTPVEVARSVLQYQWGARASIAPATWKLELAVVVAGVPVGIQGANATDFLITRTASTGSWLGVEHQGRGIGTQMRALMLHFLFEGLGAQAATTCAFADNGPSNGVTRKLGYATNGLHVEAREGAPAEILDYRLTRADWEANRAAHLEGVTFEGLDGVRAYLAI